MDETSARSQANDKEKETREGTENVTMLEAVRMLLAMVPEERSTLIAFIRVLE